MVDDVSSQLHTSEDRRLAREAQMMMDERYAENLTLQSMAAELFVGKTRLCSVFRSQMGTCVAEYLRGVRMSEARRLLGTTDMKVAEVSSAVGYSHQSSFTDAFRREFGMTPSQWRERRNASTGLQGGDCCKCFDRRVSIGAGRESRGDILWRS